MRFHRETFVFKFLRRSLDRTSDLQSIYVNRNQSFSSPVKTHFLLGQKRSANKPVAFQSVFMHQSSVNLSLTGDGSSHFDSSLF